ncbi:hypothetical protein E2C01_024507 [Portunus trituberculatus]|uniref:Uncharacterized protein n=1 Tax=Portunus trituberculatus TaxID=210409 RepID=A0A5B7EE00_PORTR|nr:hypothetical protein [Portunus trituberculatus]
MFREMCSPPVVSLANSESDLCSILQVKRGATLVTTDDAVSVSRADSNTISCFRNALNIKVLNPPFFITTLTTSLITIIITTLTYPHSLILLSPISFTCSHLKHSFAKFKSKWTHKTHEVPNQVEGGVARLWTKDFIKAVTTEAMILTVAGDVSEGMAVKMLVSM